MDRRFHNKKNRCTETSRVLLTIRQVRALNAINRSKGSQPRYHQESDHVSSVDIYQLSGISVVDRHYRRLVAELCSHGYGTEAAVPISHVQVPDTTTEKSTSSSDDDDASTSEHSSSSIASDASSSTDSTDSSDAIDNHENDPARARLVHHIIFPNILH